MTPPDPRLQRLLGGDELAALRQRLRRHFERAAPGSPPGLLRLGALNAAEREALALLTGRPPRDAKSMQVDLEAIDRGLRNAGIAASLRDALAQIGGPIRHLASVRAAAQASWSTVLAACPHPAMGRWLQSPAALGVLKRLARQHTLTAARLLAAADAVLRRLPAGGVARSQLAADTLGNAHALDPGQPIATLVLAAWRQVERETRHEGGADDSPAEVQDGGGAGAADTAVQGMPGGGASDERSRDIWARAGVLVNELARPALLLNLPVHIDETPVCPRGEPAYLSLRRLLRTPPRWDVGDRAVFVCENPNLVAIAADQLGVGCAPLVCTDGMPAAAQRALLGQLSHAGARLHYHGDFDWAGLQIANQVMRFCAARPWRFGATDYEDAVAHASPTRHALADTPVAASWDDALAPAMQRQGLAIAEEAVAASLMADLRQA